MNIRVISKINILSGYSELKTLKLYLLIIVSFNKPGKRKMIVSGYLLKMVFAYIWSMRSTENKILEKIKIIVKDIEPSAKIYPYGSRSRGTGKDYSENINLKGQKTIYEVSTHIKNNKTDKTIII